MPDPLYDQVVEYVGAVDTPSLRALYEVAVIKVDDYLGDQAARVTAGFDACPAGLRVLAIATLVGELEQRRNSPGGGAIFGQDGQVTRLSKDPMVAVRPLIRNYRTEGMA